MADRYKVVPLELFKEFKKFLEEKGFNEPALDEKLVKTENIDTSSSCYDSLCDLKRWITYEDFLKTI